MSTRGHKFVVERTSTDSSYGVIEMRTPKVDWFPPENFPDVMDKRRGKRQALSP